MNRRDFLIRSLALCAGACLGRARAVADSGSRPNILFLFADDQRADTIGALGNPHIRQIAFSCCFHAFLLSLYR